MPAISETVLDPDTISDTSSIYSWLTSKLAHFFSRDAVRTDRWKITRFETSPPVSTGRARPSSRVSSLFLDVYLRSRLRKWEFPILGELLHKLPERQDPSSSCLWYQRILMNSYQIAHMNDQLHLILYI